MTGADGTSAGPGPFRRPASLDQVRASQVPGGLDPAARAQAAHLTAHALLGRGHEADITPEEVGRLVRLVETEGLDTLAALWADSAGDSLPGALWRLYVLREWIRRAPREVADRYALGSRRAEVDDVVAGLPHPPSPDEVAALADAVLTGAVTADLDVALDRAAAFYRVVGTGAALDADLHELPHGDEAETATRRASNLVRTSQELQLAARRARAGTLR
ncbi:hypothetical protein [Litorihabitans aurantiacus]|uniref:DNA-directed RNA polymerase subunit beta n=1 Tax=Litorihabitans aurantiacus TaxID=1930061 RepID=A0AA37UTK1_9MICO|nr:hypothetical protein [Litorihabitans aurantiacus]GMA30252.1 hypothetical protein GCM10025875_02440 [Litorihabitans aurantiacus]